jgi:hypothetical protein
MRELSCRTASRIEALHGRIVPAYDHDARRHTLDRAVSAMTLFGG